MEAPNVTQETYSPRKWYGPFDDIRVSRQSVLEQDWTGQTDRQTDRLDVTCLVGRNRTQLVRLLDYFKGAGSWELIIPR